jgi:DNA-directed RNA polymerase subunit RPC12/RpoP
MKSHSEGDIDFDGEPSASRSDAPRTEFDCPECSANNPYDDGYRPGDEIRCYYCGAEFKVELSLEGKWKYRLI